MSNQNKKPQRAVGVLGHSEVSTPPNFEKNEKVIDKEYPQEYKYIFFTKKMNI